jgi:hypothetical protein
MVSVWAWARRVVIINSAESAISARVEPNFDRGIASPWNSGSTLTRKREIVNRRMAEIVEPLTIEKQTD